MHQNKLNEKITVDKLFIIGFLFVLGMDHGCDELNVVYLAYI